MLKINKIYVGQKQVRPVHTLQYYYHFVNDGGSVAQLQADGWSFYREGGIATDGWGFTVEGMRNTNNQSGKRIAWIVLDNPLTLSNANKITIQCNTYLVSGSWNGGSQAGLAANNTQFPARAGWRLNSSNNSGYNGYSLYWWNGSSDNFTSINTGDYTATAVFDFINKTALMTLTGMSNLTGTLTDTDIADIKAAQYISILFDSVGVFYKDISITVE